jgi:hypothetical protein
VQIDRILGAAVVELSSASLLPAACCLLLLRAAWFLVLFL